MAFVCMIFLIVIKMKMKILRTLQNSSRYLGFYNLDIDGHYDRIIPIRISIIHYHRSPFEGKLSLFVVTELVVTVFFQGNLLSKRLKHFFRSPICYVFDRFRCRLPCLLRLLEAIQFLR